MCGRLCAEFRWRRVLLDTSDAHAFYTCQWGCPRPVLLVYRLMAAAYVVGWNIYAWVTLPSVGDHPSIVYLTQWAYILLALYLTTAMLVCAAHYAHDRKSTLQVVLHDDWSPNEQTMAANGQTTRTSSPHESNTFITDVESRDLESRDSLVEGVDFSAGDCSVSLPTSSSTLVPNSQYSSSPEVTSASLPCHLKFMWLLFNMAAGVTPLISLVYFCVLYPYIRSENPRYSATALDINVHGISSVIIVADMCISAVPVRLLHALYPALFGTVYVIFSVVYWTFDKKNNSLYPNILDWNHPGVTLGVLCGLLFVALPLLQLLCFGFYMLRLRIYRKMYGVPYS